MSPERIRELDALARKIDHEEGASIRARGRRAFRRHERLREIVELLRAERERQGVTLAEIAERTGIDKSNLHRLENRRDANPTLGTVLRYAEALDQDVLITLRRKSA